MEQLTLFAEDSPVSRGVTPGSDEARLMTAISGRRCLEWYNKSDPVGLLAKMLLESLIWGSTKYCLTWVPKATPCNRLIFRLSPLGQGICGSEFGLLPTLTATDHSHSGSVRFMLSRKHKSVPLREYLGREFGPGYIHPEFAEALMGFPSGWTQVQVF